MNTQISISELECLFDQSEQVTIIVDLRITNITCVKVDRTSQFLCQASEDSGGVSVFGRDQSVLSGHSRTQTQHVRQFLESVLERRDGAVTLREVT